MLSREWGKNGIAAQRTWMRLFDTINNTLYFLNMRTLQHLNSEDTSRITWYFSCRQYHAIVRRTYGYVHGVQQVPIHAPVVFGWRIHNDIRAVNDVSPGANIVTNALTDFYLKSKRVGLRQEAYELITHVLNLSKLKRHVKNKLFKKIINSNETHQDQKSRH